MKRTEIENALKQVRELPTLFKNYADLRYKLQNPEVSVQEIAKLISIDPTLTSKLLRSANSPFYGLTSRVATVQHAIVIIGLESMQYLVLNTAVLNHFTKGKVTIENFDIDQLWEHAQGTAIFSRLIAKKVHYLNVEEIFTAGLIHDIGKLFIYKHFPADFGQIISETKKSDGYFLDAENQILGINHLEIGEKLLKQWNFPDTLVSTTAHHHDPAQAGPHSKEASIIHLANLLSCSFEVGFRGDDQLPFFKEDAWQTLGLDTDSLADIAFEFEKEISHFSPAAKS